ncbi:hypothetical protein Tco_1015020 [Tanacetum coccineum]
MRKPITSFNEEARLSIQHWKQEMQKVFYKSDYELNFMEKINVKRSDGKQHALLEDTYLMCKLRIKSYQYKINLTKPTLTFSGLKPYTVITKPFVGLVYLNNQKKKRDMDPNEVVKFCDCTMSRVLKVAKSINRNNKLGFADPPLSVSDIDVMIMNEKEIEK